MRLPTYIMIIVTLMVLLNILGIATTSGAILGQVGLTSPDNAMNFASSSLFSKITTALGLLAIIATVTIGFFGKNAFIFPVTAGIAVGFLAIFIGDFVGLINIVSTTLEKWVIYGLITPFLVGYTIALWDWVRGLE